jgi:hypothetical protein
MRAARSASNSSRRSNIACGGMGSYGPEGKHTMRRSAICVLGVPALLWASSFGAEAKSCGLERGAVAANELVQQCLEVSPATHPPCNISNACSMIEDEIARSCKLLDDDKPNFCDDY